MKSRESFLLVLAALAAGCSSKPAATPAAKGPEAWYSESRELWGQIAIPAMVKFTPRDDELAERVWARLDRVDEVFNIYREDSELARLNAATDREGIKISEGFFVAILSALAVHVETEGAFDVTVGPLLTLWKDAAKSGHVPSEDAINAARSLVGMACFKINDNSLTVTTPGVTFDFGGIVKGMAVDWVIAMLKDAGCTAALVQVGGETGAYGLSSKSRTQKGRTHVIGVQNPLNPLDPTDIWTAVQDPGTGISVATSGNYRQPIVIGDEVFYHIIDPRTGRPVDTHTLSVTVAFPGTGRNGLADGLSTAGAVLGPEEAIPIVEKLGGEAFFIVKDEDGRVREVKSEGWDTLVYEPKGSGE